MASQMGFVGSGEFRGLAKCGKGDHLGRPSQNCSKLLTVPKIWMPPLGHLQDLTRWPWLKTGLPIDHGNGSFLASKHEISSNFGVSRNVQTLGHS